MAPCKYLTLKNSPDLDFFFNLKREKRVKILKKSLLDSP